MECLKLAFAQLESSAQVYDASNLIFLANMLAEFITTGKVK